MFYDVFLKLCKERNIKPGRAADEIGISRATVTNWKKNGYSPRQNILEKIANYFNVSSDYFMEKKKPPAPEIRDGKGKNLVRTIGRDGSYSERWLTDEQLEALQAIINQMPDVKDDF